MKNSKTSRIVCLILSVLLLLSACGKTEPAEENPEPTPTPMPHNTYELTDTAFYKEESVYVNLRPDGSVISTSVTDRIHVDMPQVRIEDVSDLNGIADVKTFNEPVYEDGRMFWDMDSTDLYYSGTTDKEVPISVNISYTLDGKEISADKLAGKSGKLTIRITASSKLSETVYFTGEDTLVCPMLFAGGVILPEDSFSNLTTTNCGVLGDGAHKIVFFAGIPGMGESLALDSLSIPILGDAITKTEYTITADVEDFSIGNMMFAAIPFSSVYSIGGEGAIDGIEGIKRVLSDVEGMLSIFNGLDLSEITQILYGGTEHAEKLISAVGDAMELYNENKDLLEILEKYMTEDNIELLNKVIADLEEIEENGGLSFFGGEQFSLLTSLLSVFDSNVARLTTLTNDASKLMDVVSGIRAEVDAAGLSGSLEKLPETTEKLRSLISILRDSSETIESISKLMNSEAFMGLKDIASRYTGGLTALSEAQAEHLALRMREWLSYGQSYDIFTSRTESTLSSVVFIFKTEAI